MAAELANYFHKKSQVIEIKRKIYGDNLVHYGYNVRNMRNETENNSSALTGLGQKLLAHSQQAAFSAKRGLVVELFPYIFAASGA